MGGGGEMHDSGGSSTLGAFRDIILSFWQRVSSWHVFVVFVLTVSGFDFRESEWASLSPGKALEMLLKFQRVEPVISRRKC